MGDGRVSRIAERADRERTGRVVLRNASGHRSRATGDGWDVEAKEW